MSTLFCQQVLVTLAQHEAHLSPIRRPGSTNHTLILLPEVWHKLIDGKLQISKSGYKRARSELKASNTSYHHEQISLPLELTEQLKRLGAIHANDSCKQHPVCSPAMLRELLIKCGVSTAQAKVVYDTIKQACPPLQLGQVTTHMAAGTTEAPPNVQAPPLAPGMSLILRMAGQTAEWPHHIRFHSFPADLPQVDTQLITSLGSQFGLGPTINTSAATSGLRQQLAEMQSHFTRPINPFRQGRHLQANTMHDYLKTLHLFFGVVHHVEGRPLHQLSLWDCACPKYLAAFFKIQQDKGIVQGSMALEGSKLKGILSYLHIHSFPEEQQHLSYILTWFSNIKGQVVDTSARPVKLDMRDLPSLEEAMIKQDQLQQRELARFKAFTKDPDAFMRAHTRTRSFQEVQDSIYWGLHDATLFGFMFGHIPPPRLKAITTCKHPRYATSACTECKQVGCLGNRLIEKQGSSKGSRKFSLHLVHHKVANSATANPSDGDRCSNQTMSALPIQVNVPSSLQPLVEQWVDRGWKLVQEFSMGKRQMDRPTKQLLFWHPTTEKGFTDKEYSIWFKGMFIKAGFDESQTFCPQTARHLWVTTMKVHAAAGIPVPNMEGQAHIMGHLPRQWDAPIYNLLKKQVETQITSDGMEAWRQLVLMRFTQQQQQPGTSAGEAQHQALMQKLDKLIQQQLDTLIQQELLQQQQHQLQQQVQQHQHQQQHLQQHLQQQHGSPAAPGPPAASC